MFTDKSDNECFLIVDLNFDKYLLIYNNLVIKQNSKELQDKYKDLIQSKLNPVDTSSDYSIKCDLTDLNIKKCISNLDSYKNGEIGEMHILTNYIYKDKKDKEIGEAAGQSQYETIVLFDTETEQYCSFDSMNSKPQK